MMRRCFAFSGADPAVSAMTRTAARRAGACFMDVLRLFFLSGVAAVEELDDVQDFLAGGEALDAGAELQEAAGGGGHDRLGSGGAGAPPFLRQQGAGHVRLGEVVDTGAAAAVVGQ